jgi:hypothetical protein
MAMGYDMALFMDLDCETFYMKRIALLVAVKIKSTKSLHNVEYCPTL